MAAIPRNILQTPIHKENNIRNLKLTYTDVKNVKSTVKSNRKPLGTLTNQINSASKFMNKKFGVAGHVAKKIDFKIQEIPKSERKWESGSEIRTFLKNDFILEKEEEEFPEIEKMPVESPFEEKFEDVWTMNEALDLILCWFPFGNEYRQSILTNLDSSLIQDDFVIEDDPLDDLYFKRKPEPVISPTVRPAEFDIDLFDGVQNDSFLL